MFYYKAVKCFGVVLGTLLVATSAWALDVKAGLWQITLDGMPDVQKACLTRELLDVDVNDVMAMKMPEGVDCKSEVKEQSPQLTVTHTACTGQFAMESDTRMEVLSPESMKMSSTATMTIAGQQKTGIKSGAQYKWLAGDCGDVKPIDLDEMRK